MNFVFDVIACCLRVFRRVLVDKNILDIRSDEYKKLETYFEIIENRDKYRDDKEDKNND